MVMASDAVAIRAAIQTTGVTDPAALRLARIRDTLSLGELQASLAAVEPMNGAAQVEVEGSPEPLAFDDAGDLPGLTEGRPRPVQQFSSHPFDTPARGCEHTAQVKRTVQSGPCRAACRIQQPREGWGVATPVSGEYAGTRTLQQDCAEPFDQRPGAYAGIRRERMKGATRSIITWLAVAAMATLVLACEKATPAPAATPAAPAPEEPTPPEPTLLGTWERIHERLDDDGDLITTTTKLVFAESGKAFWHNSQFDVDGEDRHDPYGNIADWSATENTITKTFIHDEDDDGQWDFDTIDKSYYLSGSGNVLFVHHWDSDETEDAFERYTRVQDPVPSNPTLLGTWEAEGVYHEHDDLLDDYVIAGKKITTLTFTENRYIVVETPRDGDEVVDYWHSSGKWTPATESSVTKTFAERHEGDDGNVAIEEKSFHKEYAWGAGGELFVIVWNDDPDAGETQRPNIERYTRVTTLPTIQGTWTASLDGVDDGNPFTDTRTLTVGADGTMEYRRDVVWATGYFTFRLTGTWKPDADNLYLIVTNVVFQRTGSDDEWDDVALGADEWIRFAYAPTGRADAIIVSGYWDEQDSGAYRASDLNEGPASPYGNYWLVLEPQP